MVDQFPAVIQDALAGGAHLIIRGEMVGSQITCNPPPDDPHSDQDILLLVADTIEFVNAIDGDEGRWTQGQSLTPSPLFNSIKATIPGYHRSINLIITTNGMFFSRFMIASCLAQALNLLDKQDRIRLFRAFLYGN